MSDKILIIDDDNDSALMTTLWVRNAGFDALIAHDGVSGLAAAREHHPDVIVLDIMMEGVDGLEVNRLLREDIDLAHIPVVFLSAKALSNAHIQSPATTGGRSYLSKPYEGPDLISAINSALTASKCSV
jgi:CheY-like chemotaxis protein